MPSRKTQARILNALNYDLFNHPGLNPPAPATLYTRIAAQAMPAVPQQMFETRVTTSVPLPAVAELYRLFDEYNWFYFDGKLPFARIEYSDRMTSAGSYSPGDRVIRIGRKYHEIFPEEITDTLKHEMIHILYPSHGVSFKAEATRLGASLRAKAHPSLTRPPKFLYVCPVCSREYPRQKRLRMASCGRCSKGRFDSRFKLQLKKGETSLSPAGPDRSCTQRTG
jgi:predicted SprT family Zn-dependent metalloprotease